MERIGVIVAVGGEKALILFDQGGVIRVKRSFKIGLAHFFDRLSSENMVDLLGKIAHHGRRFADRGHFALIQDQM